MKAFYQAGPHGGSENAQVNSLLEFAQAQFMVVASRQND